MILKGFIVPFIVTFFIALFVLTMQYLWVWVDDLVGKGVGMFVIMELLFYMLLSFFPAAFPIAILLSSVMLMGGYAERYELSSLTSAGISLLRVMRSMIAFAVVIGILSFACSNYLWPVANLKFRSRLLDIKNQKPTLSIQKGVFNYDFTGYVIRVADKKSDDRTVSGIMIYDNQRQLNKINLVTAKSGEMYTDPKNNLFIMKMYNGYQYQEVDQQGNSGSRYPFIRVNFKEYTKVFDMSQFDFNRTDESLYKSHQTMLNIRQLSYAVDSIDARLHKASATMMHGIYETIKPQLRSTQPETNPIELDRINVSDQQEPVTRSGLESFRRRVDETFIKSELDSAATKVGLSSNDNQKVTLSSLIDSTSTSETFYDQLQVRYKLPTLSFAGSLARSAVNNIHLQAQIYENEYESRIRHVYEMHLKYALATVCIVFLFIGAPMGAIVRKGGFGYPLLVAIIFYMVFQVTLTSMKKSADSLVVAAWLAPWIPVIILSVIGFILTRSAMNDSKINTDAAVKFINKTTAIISSRYELLYNKFIGTNKKNKKSDPQ